jgi:hypothetical protein
MMLILTFTMVYTGHVGAHHNYDDLIDTQKFTQFQMGRLARLERMLISEKKILINTKKHMFNACKVNAKYAMISCARVAGLSGIRSGFCKSHMNLAVKACAKMR